MTNKIYIINRFGEISPLFAIFYVIGQILIAAMTQYWTNNLAQTGRRRGLQEGGQPRFEAPASQCGPPLWPHHLQERPPGPRYGVGWWRNPAWQNERVDQGAKDPGSIGGVLWSGLPPFQQCGPPGSEACQHPSVRGSTGCQDLWLWHLKSHPDVRNQHQGQGLQNNFLPKPLPSQNGAIWQYVSIRQSFAVYLAVWPDWALYCTLGNFS